MSATPDMLTQIFQRLDVLDGMAADISGLKTDVGGLKTDVAVLKTDVAEIKVRLDEHDGYFRDILRYMGKQEDEMAALKAISHTHN